MITVYTRKGCAPCQTLKYWLAKKGLEYKEILFDDSPESYPERGFRIFPLVQVDDEFVEGLNIPRLNQLISM